jgi:NAD+ kinase
VQRVGLLAHLDKADAVEASNKVIRTLKEDGIQVYSPLEAISSLSGVDGPLSDDLTRDLDVMIVLGGDGTFLRAARLTAGTGVPILGVNLGHLGFLTELEIGELDEGLQLLLQGKYQVEERMMLRVELKRRNQCLGVFLALNDAVITRGPVARIITLETTVDDQLVGNFAADGMIIATPTGSSAYNLSAGGPVVNSQLAALIITPICPHTLTATRSVLALPQERVRVKVKAMHTDIVLTVDGRCEATLEPEDEIWVCRAEETTRVIKMMGRGFYEVLRNRLAHPEV